ncbi:MAG: hypothetical protein RLZZ455_237 [Candidatus Parcubacteria bacterium]|jgi:hypothetical protein
MTEHGREVPDAIGWKAFQESKTPIRVVVRGVAVSTGEVSPSMPVQESIVESGSELHVLTPGETVTLPVAPPARSGIDASMSMRLEDSGPLFLRLS